MQKKLESLGGVLEGVIDVNLAVMMNWKRRLDLDGQGDLDRDGISDLVENHQGSDATGSPPAGWVPLEWEQLRGTVATQPAGHFGSTLQKASNGSVWDADAVSNQVIQGDGGVSGRSGSMSNFAMLGLSLSNDTSHHSDLDYAIYFQDQKIYIFESGVKQGTFKREYGINQSFTIERDGNVIFYKCDGKTLYTSSKTTDQPLHPDVSIKKTGAPALTHLLVRGLSLDADLDGDGISYNQEYEILSQLDEHHANSLAEVTPDGDGLSNQIEIQVGTNPASIYSGGGEVNWPTSALIAWFRTDQALPYAERTLLEDYLLGKHRDEGFHEESQGVDPYTYVMPSISGVTGLNFLTVNYIDYFGNVSSQTIPVIFN